MSDVSQGVGWWQASDGRWYPPKESDEAPAPGWWLAADGRWYPPVESEEPPEPGWWLAADGRWYPPESTPDGATTGYRPRFSAEEPAVAGSAPDPTTQIEAGDAEPVATAAGEPDAAEPAGRASTGRDPRRPVSVADRPPRTVEAASTRSAPARVRPTDASQQIRRRDDASREDAIAQASARFMAASRALKFLEADIEDNREHPGMSAARSTARVAHAEASGTESAPAPSVWSLDGSADPAGPTGANGKASHAGPAHDVDEVQSGGKVRSDRKVDGAASSRSVGSDESAGSVEPAGSVDVESVERDDVAPNPPPAPPPQPPKAPRRAMPDGLLIELRTSPLGADIDHIGDRLLVFDDRVELRDRNDRVRQSLPGEDITDVVVQRKFTGAVLSVESGSGDSIVTRGLKPEQADQARLLIHKQTRAGRPVTPRSEDGKPRGPQRPNPSVNGPKPPDVTAPSADAVAAAAARLAILNRDRLNEADLLRKLADLHRAGVLTDAEFEDKISLVGRLVSGETLVVS